MRSMVYQQPPRRRSDPWRIIGWIVLAVLGLCGLCVCGQWALVAVGAIAG